MAICHVRWRPSGGKNKSGGRGEFEFVNAPGLLNKQVVVRIPELSVDIDSEVVGRGGGSQGKPRLRKLEKHNRKKLHLLSLVIAAARLPDFARQDKLGKVEWPLERKRYIVNEMDFDVVSTDAHTAVLRPLTAHILHSTQVIDLQSRFAAIAGDIGNLAAITKQHPALGAAISRHTAALNKNDIELRRAADAVLAAQVGIFGDSNAAAITTIEALPPSDLEEDIKGTEGRVLTRLHSYKERDRDLVKKAKASYLAKHGALRCECCGADMGEVYGPRGKGRIQAHHRTPVEELLPDSVTTAADLAMVCPNCHDIIHAKRPWISVESLQKHFADKAP